MVVSGSTGGSSQRIFQSTNSTPPTTPTTLRCTSDLVATVLTLSSRQQLVVPSFSSNNEKEG